MGVDAIADTFSITLELAPEIRYRSGGLFALAQQLARIEDRQIATLQDYLLHKQGILEKYYLTTVYVTILKDLERSEQESLKALSLLPWFNIKVLDLLLPKVFPEYFEGYEFVQYLDLIELLGSRIIWTNEGGYAINEALRQVLEGYLEFENPVFFKDIHEDILVILSCARTR